MRAHHPHSPSGVYLRVGDSSFHAKQKTEEIWKFLCCVHFCLCESILSHRKQSEYSKGKQFSNSFICIHKNILVSYEEMIRWSCHGLLRMSCLCRHIQAPAVVALGSWASLVGLLTAAVPSVQTHRVGTLPTSVAHLTDEETGLRSCDFPKLSPPVREWQSQE